MINLRFSRSYLIKEGLRLIFGALFVGSGLFFAQPILWVEIILWILLSFFLVYALKLIKHYFSVYCFDGDAFRVKSDFLIIKDTRTIMVSRLKQIRLRAFKLGHWREGGWLTMTLVGEDKITLHSYMDGFDILLPKIKRMLIDRPALGDEVTRYNLFTLDQ